MPLAEQREGVGVGLGLDPAEARAAEDQLDAVARDMLGQRRPGHPQHIRIPRPGLDAEPPDLEHRPGKTRQRRELVELRRVGAADLAAIGEGHQPVAADQPAARTSSTSTCRAPSVEAVAVEARTGGRPRGSSATAAPARRANPPPSRCNARGTCREEDRHGRPPGAGVRVGTMPSNCDRRLTPASPAHDAAETRKRPNMTDKIRKSDAEWRAQLSDLAYKVTRQQGHRARLHPRRLPQRRRHLSLASAAARRCSTPPPSTTAAPAGRAFTRRSRRTRSRSTPTGSC